MANSMAILGYGFILKDSLVDKLEASKGYVDLGDLLVEKSGVTAISFQEKVELEKNCPAEICCCGDDENPIYALVIKDKVFSVRGRYQEIINADKLQIDPIKLEEFKTFCKKFNFIGKENWILMSRYS
jgi:hypothetical protein